MTYFRCDRSVEDLAKAWNQRGPFRPPLYEIDVLTPVGTSKEQELAERLALDDIFRQVLFPPVGATEE